MPAEFYVCIMTPEKEFVAILKKNQALFHPVVPFQSEKDKLVDLDLTSANKELSEEIYGDTEKFSGYISHYLQRNNAKYAIGGYNENRIVYSRSTVFDAPAEDEEPRRIHLGMDIWGAAGTPVYCPAGGMVHSFAMNNRLGDYGATIILLHQLDGFPFYTLYGHLSERDLAITAGSYINRGQIFGHFGEPRENGHWPPHLHFQVILDIEMMEGDYPGVCSQSQQAFYLSNCPDPDLILQLKRFLR